MFVFFGWGRQTRDNLGPALPVNCPNCHNDTFWEFITIKEFFTLFFIPIFPYETKHCLACKVCSQGIWLRGAMAEKGKELVHLYKSFQNQEISKDRYLEGVDAVNILAEHSKITETKTLYDKKGNQSAKACGTCGTENNPSFQACWKCGCRFV